MASRTYFSFFLRSSLSAFFSRFLSCSANFLNLCAVFYRLINIDDWKVPPPGDQFSSVLIIARSKSGRSSLRSKAHAVLIKAKFRNRTRWRKKVDHRSMKRNDFYRHLFRQAMSFSISSGKKVFTKIFLSFSLLVWSVFHRKLFSSEVLLPRTSCWMVWKCLSVVGKVRRDRRWFHSRVDAHVRARCTYTFMFDNILNLVARRN